MLIAPPREDVLLGRGNGTNCHEGNKAYRAIVSAFKEKYRGSRRFEKKDVVMEVYLLVTGKHRRFLEKENGAWKEVSKKKALAKIAQALRETPQSVTSRISVPDQIAISGEHQETALSVVTPTASPSLISALTSSSSTSSLSAPSDEFALSDMNLNGVICDYTMNVGNVHNISASPAENMPLSFPTSNSYATTHTPSRISAPAQTAISYGQETTYGQVVTPTVSPSLISASASSSSNSSLSASSNEFALSDTNPNGYSIYNSTMNVGNAHNNSAMNLQSPVDSSTQEVLSPTPRDDIELSGLFENASLAGDTTIDSIDFTPSNIFSPAPRDDDELSAGLFENASLSCDTSINSIDDTFFEISGEGLFAEL